ncbi:MAG: hypothetical protein JXR65_11695 [Bacteroidales bacterium]|nr:hypothetical protein [Bacteroidales bacterium]
MSKPDTLKPVNTPEIRTCLGFNAGISTMPDYLDFFGSSSELPDYYNRLKTGVHINASVYHMIKRSFGVGLEYSFFKTSTSGRFLTETSSSIFLFESEKYRQYVNYLGASVLFQQLPDVQQRFILSESLSLGVMFLQLEYQTTYPNVDQSGYNDISNNMVLTGHSISAKLGLSAEYRLFKSISVGIGGDFILGTLKKISFESTGPDNYYSSGDDLELSDPMDLSRIGCSFVVHYYFK